MRLCALLANGILPGAGQILLGYVLRGLCFFSVFGLLVDGLLYGLYGPISGESADRLILFSAFSAALVWGYGVFDVWWVAFGRVRKGRVLRRREHFRSGLVHFLCSRYPEAVHEFETSLKLDREDVDTLFYLGLAYQFSSQPRKARRLFRRCLAHRDANRWKAEALQQMRCLDGFPEGPVP
jgi:tetratricopeptide (TPR) repeat protein